MTLVYPSSYRRDFLNRISTLVIRGESMNLFGPAGIGKTTDLQLLFENEPIKKTHFGDETVSHIFINADETNDENENIIITKLAEFRKLNPGHLAIIIDHADRFIENDSLRLFSNIRAIRESSRPKTGIIALSNGNLAKYSDLGALTPIRSLLFENLIPVPLLNHEDAVISLDNWSTYYQCNLSSITRRNILKVCSGFPRFIKRLTKLAADGIDLAKVIENPRQDYKLQVDLENLMDFNNGNPENSYKIPLLIKLDKLTNNTVDRIGSIKFINLLSKQELLLAKLLIENKGKMVTREAMIEAVWQSKMYDVNEHALDQMLHRLRQKLATTTPKCKLVVFRGRGVKLTY